MRTPEIWLCLSGGNALGAFHAGAYQVLHENQLEPDRIAGASIGAMTGGLIAGNRPEQRLARLRSFWELAAEEDMVFLPFTQTAGRAAKKLSALTAFFAGRPGLFRPSVPGIWSVLPFSFSDESVLKSDPQRETLTRLIDFDLLGGGMIPLIVTAVDIETGEEVAFDSRRGSTTWITSWPARPFRWRFARSLLATGHSSIRGSLRTSLCCPCSRKNRKRKFCASASIFFHSGGRFRLHWTRRYAGRPTCCSEARAGVR
ncbi:hypothetical protein HFN65_33465 [Rhizobium laguerreae]|nr:hypothetical protein [Rhizobium laguerreae]MBY3473458.1 hypothetical protein [Rhizobium laguerreae]MBY3503325.1 hypothetical protein [Rhizobium laguerreae]MBY3522942.1 hypothetical protein [Rhizobium laguerreae]MBY3575835.1 hypothetical protein [Rhizobium laguerreae]